MTDIVLATLNARYPHCSLGLRSLLANMSDLRGRTILLEFGIKQLSVDVLDALLEHDPRIVGLGVFVWNVEQTNQLVSELKRVRPDITVVLGGPEMIDPGDLPPVAALADYVIVGEAETTFAPLCRDVLAGRTRHDSVIKASLPELSTLNLPYSLYSDEDIADRVIYVEASRGCPFTCDFCLSALDQTVREFPLERFLDAMQTLLDRGVNRFKFVDRTFNLNINTASRILEFFRRRYRPGMFLHFELVPDRLPESLRALITAFPAGSLQFEVGIQTFDSAVAERIGRRQDNDRLEENLQYLRERTEVHIHADLIVGLPGESIESFGRGFDRLIALNPQEIQVGMLKRLRGAPIVRHDADWDMIYSPHAPYQLLQNGLIDAAELARMRRLARYWDLVGNSGNFLESMPLIWGDDSPFNRFLDFCDWLFDREHQTHGIPLLRLTEHLFDYLIERRRLPRERVAECLQRDYQRGGRHDRPRFLCADSPSPPSTASVGERPSSSSHPRQSRHRQ